MLDLRIGLSTGVMLLGVPDRSVRCASNGGLDRHEGSTLPVHGEPPHVSPTCLGPCSQPRVLDYGTSIHWRNEPWRLASMGLPCAPSPLPDCPSPTSVYDAECEFASGAFYLVNLYVRVSLDEFSKLFQKHWS